MSSSTKNIYEEYIKPLPREQQVQLLDLLRNELENGRTLGSGIAFSNFTAWAKRSGGASIQKTM